MERANQLSLAPVLILGLFCLVCAHASVAAGYSYYVDYFKVVGNLPVYQRDDFNDGNISPWVVDDGTVEESGGSAILKTPGDVRKEGASIEEYTDLETPLNGVFNIAVGSGNATATSRWVKSVMPSLNQAYMMGAQFDIVTGGSFYEGEIEFDLGFINTDQANADALGLPAGLFAIFTAHRFDSGADDAVLSLQAVPIVDSTVFDAGSLFLNLHYDDLTQEVSASIVFGDDEGADAWEPFDKVAIPAVVGDLVFHDWDLEAISFSVVPTPAALPLFCSALTLFGFMGWKRKKR